MCSAAVLDEKLLSVCGTGTKSEVLLLLSLGAGTTPEACCKALTAGVIRHVCRDDANEQHASAAVSNMIMFMRRRALWHDKEGLAKAAKLARDIGNSAAANGIQVIIDLSADDVPATDIAV
jgi:hypothetical protein